MSHIEHTVSTGSFHINSDSGIYAEDGLHLKPYASRLQLSIHIRVSILGKEKLTLEQQYLAVLSDWID